MSQAVHLASIHNHPPHCKSFKPTPPAVSLLFHDAILVVIIIVSIVFVVVKEAGIGGSENLAEPDSGGEVLAAEVVLAQLAGCEGGPHVARGPEDRGSNPPLLPFAHSGTGLLDRRAAGLWTDRVTMFTMEIMVS